MERLYKSDKSKSTNPDITVAVCTYNNSDLLRLTLQQLIIQSCEGEFTYEILVVDNGSTDNTKRVVHEISKTSKVSVRYIIEDQPGLSNARNKGIAESRANWIVFFDDDQLAEQNWLKELYSVAKETGCHCVGGKRLLHFTEKITLFLSQEVRLLLGEHDKGNICRKYSGLIRDYPCDANVMRSRKLLEIVSDFNSNWTRGGQDQDYSRRVAAAGFDMWYAPKAIVYHIIKPHRLRQNYLKWTSLRWGTNFAYMDFLEFGYIKTFFLSTARLGQMILIRVPILLYAQLKRNQPKVLNQKCLIWRSVGYFRGFLFFIGGRLFEQKCFQNHLEFRKEKQIF